MSFPDIQGSITEQNVWRRIPGGGADWSDPRSSVDTTTPLEATGEVREYLDHDPSEDDCQIPHRVLEKMGAAIRHRSSSCQKNLLFHKR